MELSNRFLELSENEIQDLNGGVLIFGVTISGVLLLKVFGAGATLGATATGIYYSTK